MNVIEVGNSLYTSITLFIQECGTLSNSLSRLYRGLFFYSCCLLVPCNLSIVNLCNRISISCTFTVPEEKAVSSRKSRKLYLLSVIVDVEILYLVCKQVICILKINFYWKHIGSGMYL